MEWGLSRREGERDREKQMKREREREKERKRERWSISENQKWHGSRKGLLEKDTQEFKGQNK
jgi:hypothetical protein